MKFWRIISPIRRKARSFSSFQLHSEPILPRRRRRQRPSQQTGQKGDNRTANHEKKTSLCTWIGLLRTMENRGNQRVEDNASHVASLPLGTAAICSRLAVSRRRERELPYEVDRVFPTRFGEVAVANKRLSSAVKLHFWRSEPFETMPPEIDSPESLAYAYGIVATPAYLPWRKTAIYVMQNLSQTKWVVAAIIM